MNIKAEIVDFLNKNRRCDARLIGNDYIHMAINAKGINYTVFINFSKYSHSVLYGWEITLKEPLIILYFI